MTRPFRVGQVERSDTCRSVRYIDGRQVSFLDLPYGICVPADSDCDGDVDNVDFGNLLSNLNL